MMMMMMTTRMSVWLLWLLALFTPIIMAIERDGSPQQETR